MTSGAPDSRNRAATAAIISAVTRGMSARTTAAASASGGTAAIPARAEEFMPRA
jgi:hypothetical protein